MATIKRYSSSSALEQLDMMLRGYDFENKDKYVVSDAFFQRLVYETGALRQYRSNWGYPWDDDKPIDDLKDKKELVFASVWGYIKIIPESENRYKVEFEDAAGFF